MYIYTYVYTLKILEALYIHKSYINPLYTLQKPVYIYI